MYIVGGGVYSSTPLPGLVFPFCRCGGFPVIVILLRCELWEQFVGLCSVHNVIASSGGQSIDTIPVCVMAARLGRLSSDEARPRERIDRGRFLPIGKKTPPHTGVRTRCHYLICLSVNIRHLY